QARRFRPAGKDNALWRKVTHFQLGTLVVPYFTIYPQFTYTTGNELGVLGAEIKNQNFVAVDVLLRHDELREKNSGSSVSCGRSQVTEHAEWESTEPVSGRFFGDAGVMHMPFLHT